MCLKYVSNKILNPQTGVKDVIQTDKYTRSSINQQIFYCHNEYYIATSSYIYLRFFAEKKKIIREIVENNLKFIWLFTRLVYEMY